MVAQDTNMATPENVGRMFALIHGTEQVWRQAELGTILQRQLDANLVADLSQGDPIMFLHVAELVAAVQLCSPTLRSLLLHPHPPEGLLELAKQLLKSLRQETGGLFAAEVATVLYYAVITVARVRLNARISALSDHALSAGCYWGLAQSWIDPTIRQILQSGISQSAVS